MQPKKILTIVGARPQFIKAAVVSSQFSRSSQCDEIMVHTGQHYDANMSDVFFEELGIPQPKHHLGIGSGGHGMQTGRMLEALEGVMLQEQPDWVLVYGDTNSTLAGALAAVKLHIPVAHVEAGLRSFNRQMPEEINRVLTDHASSLLFVPTQTALEQLKKEGIPDARVLWTGDVMYDAALHFGKKPTGILQTLQLEPKSYVLATIHRAENTDNLERLRVIFAAFAELAKIHPVVLPLHPRTRHTLEREGIVPPGVHFLEPVGYLDMVTLTKGAALVATDSGGLQKEAFFHRVPCVTLRDETEWVELLELGWNRLAPPHSVDSLTRAFELALGSHGLEGNPYGEGDAAQRILNALENDIQADLTRFKNQ
jgi:UDP-GlcNAc3NAcA epimerase